MLLRSQGPPALEEFCPQALSHSAGRCTQLPPQGRQPGDLLTHLGPVITEDPHHTDRNSLVQTAPQGFAVESKYKGNVLLTGVIDDGVQGVIQATWSKDSKMTELHHTRHGADAGCKGLLCVDTSYCLLK